MTGPTDSPHPSHPYIRRRGRTTVAQARGLSELLARYRVEPADWAEASAARRGLEIGFGMGHGLLEWARQVPASRLLGVELYEPGIGALVDRLHKLEVANVAVVDQPAQDVVAALPDGCLDEVRVFFPDPWPKKRHHKRRLLQPAFVTALARVMNDGALLRVATDWTPYADWVREVMEAQAGFATQLDTVRAAEQSSVDDDVSGAAEARPRTNFERRGERLGHDIHDLIYVRKRSSTESR